MTSEWSLAATIYVPDHYQTIQSAINAASNGDTIIVRPGVYIENMDYIGKKVVVRSEQGPEVTIIDGNQAGSVVTFQNGEDENSAIDGFILTNGNAIDGGGIYCNGSSPIISNNIITSNNGGGICCISCSPIISKNDIINNIANHLGGGIFVAWETNPVISYNLIANNQALGGGGGIYVGANSESTIHHNIICGNTTGYWGGGGINLWSVSAIYGTYSYVYCNLIINNTATGTNQGEGGGGIYSRYDTSLIYNNTFVGNSAYRGGGIYILNQPSCVPVIYNCIFWDNNASSIGPEIHTEPSLFVKQFGLGEVLRRQRRLVRNGKH